MAAMVVAPLDRDHRFRTLRHPEIFTAVLRTVPTFAAWLDVLDPISPVFPMAAVDNTLRRLVVGGVPVATGLHALGDAVCTTNPTLGRGLSLALQGAADLLDASPSCAMLLELWPYALRGATPEQLLAFLVAQGFTVGKATAAPYPMEPARILRQVAAARDPVKGGIDLYAVRGLPFHVDGLRTRLRSLARSLRED
jgi:2-polyprenyl-6-methoxyphenol hydroxylase-like FAD-dependent oxidoreductase